MYILSLALAIICLHVAHTAVREPKVKAVKKEKPINWNLSYYSEPFGLCKPLRILNPVKQARAHGFAVDIFRRCGPTFVIPYAERFNFPAYAIEKAIEVFCFLSNLGEVYFDVTTPAGVDVCLSWLRRFRGAWKISNFSLKVKFRNETFFITLEMCNGLIYDIFECAFKKAGLQRSEYAKYTALHFKRMLL